MKRFSIILGLLVASVLQINCSGDNDANYKALIANRWQLKEIIGLDSIHIELPPTAVEITFTDSTTLSGFAGCNNFFGTFSTYEQDEITINPVGRTMSMCPYIKFEDQFMNLLPMCTSYTASASELELNDTENDLTLLFTPVKN